MEEKHKMIKKEVPLHQTKLFTYNRVKILLMTFQVLILDMFVQRTSCVSPLLQEAELVCFLKIETDMNWAELKYSLRRLHI